MNRNISRYLIVAGCFFVGTVAAPAQAPANATGVCKDGTYSTAAAKDGACRGHKGVQTWYSAAKPAAAPSPASTLTPAPVAPARARASVPPPQPAPASPTTAVPAPAAAAAKPGISAERAKLATMQPAAGGGPGLVWLNGSSKVYHCPGTEFYGKTKTGAYVSEADAKAKGAHADHNKPCG